MRACPFWLLALGLLWSGYALDGSGSALTPVYEASRERPVSTKGVYAIINATVYPVSMPPIEGATVLIRDGRIEAVGKA
ncbi:MAG: hypothetical protein NZL85_04675, partial [Fimbriimonadales bacterium]|nr:hypothetical protein [Fimbriimonadales bacterium]